MKDIIKKGHYCQSGQALVTLLIFTAMALTIIGALTIIAVVNSQSSQSLVQGQIAYNIAESGAENALSRLLRNPNFSGGNLSIDTGTAEVVVSGYPNIQIISTGKYMNYSKKIEIQASIVDNVLTIISWKEID